MVDCDYFGESKSKASLASSVRLEYQIVRRKKIAANWRAVVESS